MNVDRAPGIWRCRNGAGHPNVQSTARSDGSIRVRPLEEGAVGPHLPVRECAAGPTGARLFHGRWAHCVAIQPGNWNCRWPDGICSNRPMPEYGTDPGPAGWHPEKRVRKDDMEQVTGLRQWIRGRGKSARLKWPVLGFAMMLQFSSFGDGWTPGIPGKGRIPAELHQVHRMARHRVRGGGFADRNLPVGKRPVRKGRWIRLWRGRLWTGERWLCGGSKRRRLPQACQALFVNGTGKDVPGGSSGAGARSLDDRRRRGICPRRRNDRVRRREPPRAVWNQ